MPGEWYHNGFVCVSPTPRPLEDKPMSYQAGLPAREGRVILYFFSFFSDQQGWGWNLSDSIYSIPVTTPALSLWLNPGLYLPQIQTLGNITGTCAITYRARKNLLLLLHKNKNGKIALDTQADTPPPPLGPIPPLTAYLLLLDLDVLISNLPFSPEEVWEEGLGVHNRRFVLLFFFLLYLDDRCVHGLTERDGRELVLGWYSTCYDALSSGTSAIILPASGLYTATSGRRCWKFNPHLLLPPPPTPPSPFGGPSTRGQCCSRTHTAHSSHH